MKRFKQGDQVKVGDVLCEVSGINTDGMDAHFKKNYTFVKPQNCLGNFWVPNVFVTPRDGKLTVSQALKRADYLRHYVGDVIEPLVKAIGDHLSAKRSPLGMAWLCNTYEFEGIQFHPNTWAWAYDEEQIFRFEVDISYWNEDHQPDNYGVHSPLTKRVDIRVPLALAENFTKVAFNLWVKKEIAAIAKQEVEKAEKALEAAKKLQRA